MHYLHLHLHLHLHLRHLSTGSLLPAFLLRTFHLPGAWYLPTYLPSLQPLCLTFSFLLWPASALRNLVALYLAHQMHFAVPPTHPTHLQIWCRCVSIPWSSYSRHQYRRRDGVQVPCCAMRSFFSSPAYRWWCEVSLIERSQCDSLTDDCRSHKLRRPS